MEGIILIGCCFLFSGLCFGLVCIIINKFGIKENKNKKKENKKKEKEKKKEKNNPSEELSSVDKMHKKTEQKLQSSPDMSNMANRSEYENYGSLTWDKTIVKSKTDGKLGVVYHRNGEFFLPMCYDDIWQYTSGLIRVKKEGKSGILSANGDVLCPVVWDSAAIHEVEGGEDYLFHVEKDGKHGLIDKVGNTLIPIEYENIYEFGKYNGNTVYDPLSAIVMLQDKFGVVDFNGNIIVPIMYDIEFKQVSHSLIGAERKDGKWDICHKGGKLVPLCPFDDIRYNHLGLIPAKKDGKWGFLDDQEGKIVAPFVYDEVNSNNDYWEVSRDGLWGHIGQKGILLTPCIWEEIYFNLQEHYIVKKDGLYGILNKYYFELIPPTYEYIQENKSYAIVRKNGKYGSIDLRNNVIIPLIYDELDGSDSFRRLVVKKDGKYGFLDKKGNVIVPIIYDYINFWGVVRLGEISGSVNKNGQVVLNKKEYVDENGQVHESDQSSTGGTYMFTDARTIITADNEIIKLDDVLYCTRILGEPGSVSTLKLMANGERKDETEEFSIGSTQHDYYEYMDHQENELYIVTKNKEYECVEDKDYLWRCLNNYFITRR